MKRMFDQLSKDEQADVESALDCCFPKVLPAEWPPVESYVNAQWHQNSAAGLVVCFEVEMNGEDLWIHISLSRRDRVPSYEDLAEVKAVFLGPWRKAILVLPPKAEHYNLHPFCLHLYSPISRDPLPDFRTEDRQL